MTVVVDEFYGPVSAVFISVEDVTQDDWSPEDLFQLSYVIDRSAGFVDSLFPLLDLLSPCGCESMAYQSALKVLHNSLNHTVEVAIFQRSEVGQIWVSDGVEAIGNCGDGVGVLIEHTVDSSQYPRACVPSDLNDPPRPFFRSAWTGSNLSSRTQSSSAFSLRNLILRRNSMPPWRAAQVGQPWRRPSEHPVPTCRLWHAGRR